MIKETITDAEQQLRVFSDTDCTTNLRVWYEPGGDMNDTAAIREFRLTYHVLTEPHGVLWRKKQDSGETREIYAHVGIDDGEDGVSVDPDGHRLRIPVKQAASPVLNGIFQATDVRELAEDFMARTSRMDQAVARFVYEKILAFPPEQYVEEPHDQ